MMSIFLEQKKHIQGRWKLLTFDIHKVFFSLYKRSINRFILHVYFPLSQSVGTHKERLGNKLIINNNIKKIIVVHGQTHMSLCM